MSAHPNFAINRIMQPDLSLSDFLALALECSASGIEIRNDLPDSSLLGGENPDMLLDFCRSNNIGIVTVNALQRFNDPDLFKPKVQELTEIMEVAASVDCSRIVLCPVNDSEDSRNPAEQHRDLVSALAHYAPLFEKYNMTGLIEPLGFEICSVRYKKQAVKAIAESGFSSCYEIVHDTFHHYLSGETDFFPEETGLIHASGVYEGKNIEKISDDDRYLVDDKDIMDNRGQISRLYRDGFQGIMSFEPFSPGVQNLSVTEVQSRIRQSMDLLFS